MYAARKKLSFSFFHDTFTIPHGVITLPFAYVNSATAYGALTFLSILVTADEALTQSLSSIAHMTHHRMITGAHHTTKPKFLIIPILRQCGKSIIGKYTIARRSWIHYHLIDNITNSLPLPVQ